MLQSVQIPVATVSSPTAAVTVSAAAGTTVALSSSDEVVRAVQQGRDVGFTAYTLRPGRFAAGLEAAAGRGAHVRVVLEAHPYDGGTGELARANAEMVSELRSHGVAAELHDAGKASLHMKAAVVDGVAFLDDRNWPDDGRDTIVRTADRDDVAAIAQRDRRQTRFRRPPLDAKGRSDPGRGGHDSRSARARRRLRERELRLRAGVRRPPGAGQGRRPRAGPRPVARPRRLPARGGRAAQTRRGGRPGARRQLRREDRGRRRPRVGRVGERHRRAPENDRLGDAHEDPRPRHRAALSLRSELEPRAALCVTPVMPRQNGILHGTWSSASVCRRSLRRKRRRCTNAISRSGSLTRSRRCAKRGSTRSICRI